MTLYDYAIRYLTVREHSRFELKNKLMKKSEDEEEIEQVLDRLESEKFLSDARFCSSYLRSRLRKNIEGKSILKLRLMAKGIDRALADIEIDNFFSENDDEIRKAVLAKYEKTLMLKGEDKAKKMLYQKGFSLDDTASDF